MSLAGIAQAWTADTDERVVLVPQSGLVVRAAVH